MAEVTAAQQLSESDAALLVSAHLELLVAQAEGVSVLGSDAGADLVATAYTALGAPRSVALTTAVGERIWLTDQVNADSVAAATTTRNEVPA